MTPQPGPGEAVVWFRHNVRPRVLVQCPCCFGSTRYLSRGRVLPCRRCVAQP